MVDTFAEARERDVLSLAEAGDAVMAQGLERSQAVATCVLQGHAKKVNRSTG